MPAAHKETSWTLGCPAAYRDRIKWDPVTGVPVSFDTASGPYVIPGPMSNADMLTVGLPPLTPRLQPHW